MENPVPARDILFTNPNLVETVHAHDLREVITPYDVKTLLPATKESLQTVLLGRKSIQSILQSESLNKLLVLVGPCSLHDPEAGMRYAQWLQPMRQKFGDRLELVMRAYFEKPRSTVGWKGLINDPHLNGTYDINTGLMVARKLVCDITHSGVPVGTELLDVMTPQYLGGLMSWGAIGARTTESQPHRELVSGLSFPVGFKNGTDGNVRIAIDAITAASHPHNFLSLTDKGMTTIVASSGNPDCHIILRGGSTGTNYDETSVGLAAQSLIKANLPSNIMVDCSHGNSQKNYKNQMIVIKDIAHQIKNGNKHTKAVMIESNLVEGQQPFNPNGELEYGKSITDGCVGLEETEEMFERLYEACETVA